MEKDLFLKDLDNQNNHRILLFEALEKTKGDVIEMGMGHGSTPYLHEYCKINKRNLFSYETSSEWFKKFEHLNTQSHRHTFIENWDTVHNLHKNPSVVLVDHAPGERRKIDIEKWRGNCIYLVAHDTEPAADHGYKMRDILSTYKYMKDYETKGAWSTIVSMTRKV